MLPTLTNKLVILQPITAQDTADIVAWRNMPHVRKNFIDQRDITPEGHAHWLETMVDSGKVHQFIIVDASDGARVGSVFLRDIDTTHSHAEFGVFIGDESKAGKGLGTAACRCITQYAFEELRLQRVFLRVLVGNAGAIRSYAKAGYREEGCFRKHAFVNGSFSDVIFMGQLKEEFVHGE